MVFPQHDPSNLLAARPRPSPSSCRLSPPSPHVPFLVLRLFRATDVFSHLIRINRATDRKNDSRIRRAAPRARRTMNFRGGDEDRAKRESRFRSFRERNELQTTFKRALIPPSAAYTAADGRQYRRCNCRGSLSHGGY